MDRDNKCECGQECMLFSVKGEDSLLCPVCDVDEIVRIAMELTYQNKYKSKGGHKRA